MRKGILGVKLGMTQIFAEDGKVVPVTLIQAGPCVVTQIKTEKTDGYEAVQIGFGEVKESKLTSPERGHLAGKGIKPLRYLKELRMPAGDLQVGAELKADIFAEGDRADVIGISKGKGFAGVIKRHGYAGGPAGHGSHFHRAPGSIGQAASPSRVFKGTRLPGRMGGKQATVLNLEVVQVRPDDDLILLRGAVPGPTGKVVLVRQSVRGAGKGSKKNVES